MQRFVPKILPSRYRSPAPSPPAYDSSPRGPRLAAAARERDHRPRPHVQPRPDQALECRARAAEGGALGCPAGPHRRSLALEARALPAGRPGRSTFVRFAHLPRRTRATGAWGSPTAHPTQCVKTIRRHRPMIVQDGGGPMAAGSSGPLPVAARAAGRGLAIGTRQRVQRAGGVLERRAQGALEELA
jgi:hypothetical protein